MAIVNRNLSNVEVFKNVANKLYVEFLEKSITHGMRMIRRTEGDSYGRYIWLGFMAWILVLTHMDVYRLLIAFMQAPTEIRLSPKVLHVKNVIFPGIAICNNNQISRKSLNEFSEKLYQFQERYHPNLTGNSSNDIAEKLLAFSGFLLHPTGQYTTLDKRLQSLHDLLVYKFGNESYPTRDILRALAPKCKHQILRCYHGNYNPINCSDVITMRITAAGACCIINYKRRKYVSSRIEVSDSEENNSVYRSVQVDTSGKRSSIEVVMQDDTEDHALKALTCDGYRIVLFYDEDYPDTDMGSATTAIVGHNEENEISIVPDLLEGSPRMRQFSPKSRHCFFLDEGQQLLKRKHYSFSECMLDCRIRSVISHCGCIIPVLPNIAYNASYCVLLDLPCLTLWKSSWWQYSLFDYVAENPQAPSKLETCSECLPSCNVMRYKISLNTKPLNLPRNGGNYNVGMLDGLNSSIPTTVIKLFYKTAFSQIKTHDVSGDWVVLLGRYGGICGIMYGFSILAIIEALYFISGKWLTLWWKCLVECYKNRLRRKIEVETQQELYWNELRPKGSFLNRELNHF